MKKGILVIGSLNADMLVDLERMPAVGETVLGRSYSDRLGGKGANQACAAAKLGGAVKMLGCVGRDKSGRWQREYLSACGVDTAGLKESEDAPTGTAVIYVDAAGDNSIVVIPGANEECDVAYLKEQDEAFRQCDYVLLQMEIPQEAVLYAAQRARQLHKTVVLNPAPAPDRLPDGLLELVDYLTPNETELLKLSELPANEPDEKALEAGARKLLERGAGAVIATLGEKGALLVKREEMTLFPARKVKALDTTAAGDCFNGAFLTALADGRTEAEAITFANLASSVAVTKKGAMESLPDLAQLQELY